MASATSDDSDLDAPNGQWLWKGGGSWKPFEEAIGSNIELGFLQFRDHGGPHEVSISGTRVVDLRTLRQMRSEDRSRTRPVRRIALPTAAAPAAAASPALATSGTGAVHVAGRAPARVDVPQVQWMWSDRGVWKPYDVTVSTALENSHGEGKQTVDIDTERYVDLSSMYQCRRDDPRRRRKVRRDAVATTGADGLPPSSPSRNATPSQGVTVSNVAVDEPTATAARSASGTVSNSATEISTVDDISSSSMPPAAVNANAARVSAETDDDMDTKLKARMARFAAKRKRQESTAVGAAVTDLVSTSAHNSSLPASTCDSSSGAAASSSLMDKYTDGPGTLDLVGSNNDAAEASATLSLSLPTSSAYAAAGDSPDQQGSVKRKAGVQSSLSDFFNRSPVPVKQSSRPSVDPPGNHTDDSLSVLQASQSQHTGDDGFTSAPAPKKHRKLPGWMTGAEAKAGNRKNAQATTAHASPSSPPSQSSRLRGTDEDDLVYLGLRTPQKAASISAAASDSAASDSAAVRGERYSEGKSWNEIKEGFLDMLAALERSEKDKGDITRASAYSKAANAIRDHDGELVNGKEAKKLKGIGPKIAAKFDEFLEKGSLGRVERDRNDPRAVALQALNTVNGVGPVLAKKLLDENGIDSVAALVAALHSGKVSVNNDVRVGLKHYEDLLHRIPRNEMELLKAVVEDTAAQLDHDLRVEVLGSYRRGAKSSGDVDCLITHPRHTRGSSNQHNFVQRLVDRLRRRGFLIDDIVSGETKYMGVCRLNDAGYGIARRIDIMGIVQEEWACAVTYFTGSGAFNRKMRQHAVEAGFTLNEHALCPVDPQTKAKGAPLPIPDERSLFARLGLAWVAPADRELGK